MLKCFRQITGGNMSKYKNAHNLLEEKATNKEKKPIYATRKLSIGLVSCMLGILSFMPQVKAEGEEATLPKVAEEAQNPNPTEGTETQNPADGKENSPEKPAEGGQTDKQTGEGKEALAPTPVPVVGQDRASNSPAPADQQVKEVLTADEIKEIKKKAKFMADNKGYEFTDKMVDALKAELEKIKDSADFETKKKELIEKAIADNFPKNDKDTPVVKRGWKVFDQKTGSTDLDGADVGNIYMGEPHAQKGRSDYQFTYQAMDPNGTETIKSFAVENAPNGTKVDGKDPKDAFDQDKDPTIKADNYKLDGRSVDKVIQFSANNQASAGKFNMLVKVTDGNGNTSTIKQPGEVKVYKPAALSTPLTAKINQKNLSPKDAIGIYHEMYKDEKEEQAIRDKIKAGQTDGKVIEGTNYLPANAKYEWVTYPTLDKATEGENYVIASAKVTYLKDGQEHTEIVENIKIKVIDTEAPFMHNGGKESGRGKKGDLDDYTLAPIFMGEENGRINYGKGANKYTYKAIDNSGTIVDVKAEGLPPGTTLEEFKKGVDELIKATKFDGANKECVAKKLWVKADSKAKEGLYSFTVTAKDPSGNTTTVTNHIEVKVYVPAAKEILQAEIYDKSLKAEDAIGIYREMYDNEDQKKAIEDKINQAIKEAKDKNQTTGKISDKIVDKAGYLPEGTTFEWKLRPGNTDLNLRKAGLTTRTVIVTYTNKDGEKVSREVKVLINVKDSKPPIVWRSNYNTGVDKNSDTQLDGKDFGGHSAFIGDDNSLDFTYRTGDNSGQIKSFTAEGAPVGTVFEGEESKGLDANGNRDKLAFSTDEQMLNRKIKIKATSKNKVGDYKITFTSTDNLGENGGNKTVVNNTIPVKAYLPVATKTMVLEKAEDATKLSPEAYIGAYLEKYDTVNARTKDQVKADIDGDNIDKSKISDDRAKYFPKEGTKYEWVEAPNTNQAPGTYKAKAKVTFTKADGTEVSEEVLIPYEVKEEQKPTAPSVKTDDQSGDVTVTPATEDKTKSIDVTYTGVDGQKHTVTATKDDAGKWSVPAGSDINIDADSGVVTVPASKTQAGTEVTAVAKNIDQVTNPVTATTKPSAPLISEGAEKGSLEITPQGNTDTLTITYTPEGKTQQETVEIKKDADGNWQNPTGHPGITVDEMGVVTIANGTGEEHSELKVSAKVGNSPATEVKVEIPDVTPPNPPKLGLADDKSGDATITPAEDDTSKVTITYVGKDGTSKTVDVEKKNGSWTVPDASGLKVSQDGKTIIVPKALTQDETEVKATSADEHGNTSNEKLVKVPDKTSPSQPKVVVDDKTGNIIVTPPTDADANQIVIEYKDKDEDEATAKVFKKDDTGKWVAEDGSGLTVDDNGNIVVPAENVYSGSEITAKAYDKAGNDSAPVTKTTKPDAPEVKASQKTGDVDLKPSEGTDTLEFTYTPKGKRQAKTVKVKKNPQDAWEFEGAHPDLKLSAKTGHVTIPKGAAEEKTPVTAKASIGSEATSLDSTNKVPDKTQPATPKFQAKEDGSIEIDFPVDDATSITVEYIDKDGNKQTATLTKEKAQWSVPRDSVFDSKGDKLILPADKVQGGSPFTVKTQDEAGNISDPKNGTVSPDAPTISEKDGLVTITPPANADSQEIVYTPKGSETPVKVTAEKDEKGEWKLPEGTKGLEIDAKTGAVTIAKGNAKDGEPIKAITKLGKGNTAIPSKESTVNAPDTTGPAKPSIESKEDGKVTVTPPSDKDTKTLAISYKDKNGNDQVVSATKYDNGSWKLDKEVEGVSIDENTGTITLDDGLTKAGTDVKATAKDKSENPSEEAQDIAKTLADRTNPKTPVKWKVDNPTKLTDDEKEAVKKAIEDENKDEKGKSTLPEGSEVVVGDDGTATITYKDGTKDTINGTDLVEKKADKKALEEESGKEQATKADHKYKNADKEKQSAYDKALEEAKKVLANQGASQKEVDEALAKLQEAAKALDGKETQGVPSGQASNEVKVPEKTEVKDLNKLTKEERAKIAEKIKKANPSVKDVVVDEKGNATVTNKDGSKTTIQASKLVKKASGVQVPNVPSKDKKKEDANKSKNVKTGVESLGGVVATLATAASGLFVSKKRKNK